MSDTRRSPLSPEQRARLHRLADLGGLVLIAGLDRYPPDVLLGVLLDAATRVERCGGATVEHLRQRGRARLEARGAEKRAWKSWHDARELHRIDLTTVDISRIITRFGAVPPGNVESAVAQLLNLVRSESTCETPTTS